MVRRWIAPIAWLLLATITVGLVAFAVGLFLAGLDLNGRQGLSSSERASILQAFAAAGALAGTAALLGVTGYYARVTAKILESGRPLIEVELKQAWVHPSGTGCLTLGLERGIASSPPNPDYPLFMFAIEVRNTGGAAATVDKAAIKMEKGVEFWQPAPTIGPGFPHRLEPHASVTFFVEPQAVSAAVEALKLKEEVAAFVVLASGPVHRTAKVRLERQK